MQKKNKIKLQTFLARVPLFNTMRPDELDRIALGTTETHVERGVMVYRRGDPCDGFYTVVYGQVKLSFISEQGAEKVIELVGPGHSFGEALMFMGQPYTISAQAMADSLLLHVSTATVIQEIDRVPGFARKMMGGLSQRIHGLMCDLESNSLWSGTQRVINYLLGADTSRDGNQLTLPVAKCVLASRLSLTPEHFSRIMADLSNKHLITVKGRNVTILDMQQLSSFAV